MALGTSWGRTVFLTQASGACNFTRQLANPKKETTCVCLPAVQKYNAKTNGAQQQIILDALWSDPVVARVFEQHGLVKGKADLGDALDTVIRALGLPRKLKEYNIAPKDLVAIAENSLKDACCKKNPIPLVEKDQVLEILRSCLG